MDTFKKLLLFLTPITLSLAAYAGEGTLYNPLTQWDEKTFCDKTTHAYQEKDIYGGLSYSEIEYCAKKIYENKSLFLEYNNFSDNKMYINYFEPKSFLSENDWLKCANYVEKINRVSTWPLMLFPGKNHRRLVTTIKLISFIPHDFQFNSKTFKEVSELPLYKMVDEISKGISNKMIKAPEEMEWRLQHAKDYLDGISSVSEMTLMHQLDGRSSVAFNAAVYSYCAFHSITDASSCSNGLKWISENSKVNGDFSFPGVALDAIGEDKLFRVGYAITKKLLNRLTENRPVKSNLFDDLQNTFIEAGISEKEASELTWKFIGFSSLSGGNTAELYKYALNSFQQNALPLLLALHATSTIPLVIDRINLDAGLPLYSLPKGVISYCDTGKPYHFYLSAYLARQLRKQGLSSSGASLAASLSGITYQMMSKTMGRNPEYVLRVHPLDFGAHKIRLDINSQMLGAIFGSETEERFMNRRRRSETSLKELVSNSPKTKENRPNLEMQALDQNLNDLDYGLKFKYFEIWRKIFPYKSVFFNIQNKFESNSRYFLIPIKPVYSEITPGTPRRYEQHLLPVEK